MFPFNLPGPDFLLLYAIVALVASVVAGKLAKDAAERSPIQLPLSDPYEIAYVRANADEVVRVAVLSLIDRGLLSWNMADDTIVATPLAHGNRQSHPVERVILHAAKQPVRARELLQPGYVDTAQSSVGGRLSEAGYTHTAVANLLREPRMRAAWLFLTVLAGGKVLAALAGGRQNVAFLVTLWVASSAALVYLTPPSPGKAVLDQLRSLLADLRNRAATLMPGRATNELALLVATFGFDVVPAHLAPYATGIQRELRRKSDGGSGCGGGGDGGGCGGGCGGCGGG